MPLKRSNLFMEKKFFNQQLSKLCIHSYKKFIVVADKTLGTMFIIIATYWAPVLGIQYNMYISLMHTLDGCSCTILCGLLIMELLNLWIYVNFNYLHMHIHSFWTKSVLFITTNA